MKGIEGHRLHRRGAEDGMIYSDERSSGVYEKAAGMQSYVHEFMSNDLVVSGLIKQKFADKINSNKATAEQFARENDFLIPKDVKELGMEYQTAFVLALVDRLSVPEYNQ